MYLGITKLAELIVLAAKNVSEKSWCTQINIGPILGIKETDNFFGEINVMDDSGYRYIVIGNTKNNLTVIRGRKTKKEDHMDNAKPQDMSYYDGAIEALVFAGYDWERDAQGKHTLYMF